MPSVLSRLASLFPAYRRTYAPAVATPEERAARVIAAAKAQIEQSRRRPRPSSDEKVPVNYSGGIAGKVWFHPYLDSGTRDTPEIRAAMRLMRRSPWVATAWEPAILTVAAEDWQVQASEPGNPESEEQADAFKAMIEDYLAGGIISVVRAVCAPLGSEGHSLAEPVWNPGRQGKLAKHIVCTKLSAKDTDDTCGDVRLGGDTFGNVKWVQARRAPEQPAYPIEDFVFSRYMTVFDEPLGLAAYRPAYGAWWMLDTVDKLRVIHHEKRMAGMLMGTYQSDDDKPALEDALRKAKSATWIAVPEGVRIEAINLSAASEPDYKSFAESKRDEVVSGITFATLQSLVSAAPELRGDSKVQKSIADLVPWLLMALVTDAVNKQLAPKFVDFNYPYPAGGAYPKLTFGAASNQELLELLQVVQGAQAIGFTGPNALSKKHYAKAFSLQLADPNDPDDALQLPGPSADPMGGMGMGGMGGMGGGFPPGPSMGGDPAMLPPGDPSAGGGAAVPFAEQRVHVFGWDDWKQTNTPAGPRMVSASGKRSLTLESFQRLSSRTRAGGALPKARGAGPAPVRAPAPPQAPAAPEPPAAPKPPASPVAPAAPTPASVAPAPTTARGALAARRAAAAAGRGAKAAARTAGDAAALGLAGGSSTVQGAGWAAEKLGQAIRRVPLLDSVGAPLERFGKALKDEARSIAIQAMIRGQKGAATRKAVKRVLKAAAPDFYRNYKIHGLGKALVMEAGTLALSFTLGTAAVGGALALAGLAGAPGVAGLAVGTVAGKGLTATALLGAGAKTYLSGAVSGIIRKAVQAPFYGRWNNLRGTRGAGTAVRKADAAMEARRAQDLGTNTGGLLSRAKRALLLKTRGPKAVARAEARAKLKAARAGMVAGPSAAVGAARNANNRAGGRDFYRGPGQASQRKFFAEAAGDDPLGFVVAFREQAERAIGRPVDLTDEQLAALLADLLEYLDEATAAALDEDAPPQAESFAERAAEQGLEWAVFGWQPARTRSGGVKAVGTAEHQGQVLYGDRARAALERQAGVGRRATAPRTLTFETVGPRGGVKRTVERGVSPERAREVVAQQARRDAQDGPADPRAPRLVKINRTRIRKAVTAQAAELAPAAARAGSDPAAAAKVADAGKQAVTHAAAELKKLGPLPEAVRPVIRSTWLDAARGMPKGQRKEVGNLLEDTLGRDVDAAGDLALKLGGYLAKLPAGGAKLVVGALGRFAGGLVRAAVKAPRTAKRLAGEVVGDVVRAGAHDRQTASNLISGAAGAVTAAGRAALAVPRTLAGHAADAAVSTAVGTGQGLLALARETLRLTPKAVRAGWGAAKWLANSRLGRAARPFLWWGAALVGGAAVMAAPVLAAGAGLIPPLAGFLAAPAAVAGTVYLGRKIGRKAADAGMRATGNDEVVPHSERVHAFAWHEWTRQGDRMVSPGGKRSLTLDAFQKLSARRGGTPAPGAAGVRAPAPGRSPFAPPASPQPGRVYQVAPGRVAVDPGRFQFKLNTNARGVGTELAHVTTFDPELAGVLAVWKDPADGRTYVVNGHHRLDLANRTGARDVSVRYVTAKTAEEARAKGALINIAEGRGTAVDAAKFLRDTGRSAADLAAAGISLKGQVARDAADLVKLAPDLFRQVAHGSLDPDRAAAVARHLDDHLDQQRLLSALAKQEERTGRPAGPRVVEAMAQEMRDAPKVSRTQESLFGPIEQDESVYFHRAELKAYVRAELAKEAKDFRLGASVRRAQALESVAGNRLATEQNRTIADRADAALDDFDRGARLKGPLSDLLNEYAVHYADATNAGRSQLRAKTLAAVRNVLSGSDPGAAPVVAKRGPGLFD
ncbi:hypothetical protein GobsT_37570 [Gemmata obscuriglobus]|uniref:ParB/Sulfiredoxin domain-containing protein n=1 Tax=Gemmata obscuriglobus TaxID=114 RepID=A0A2Z3H4V7_9BACT|nr:hypothetical protein [Gemmata obscuriglobus]AWM38145.1 hypothetical protein C1280_14840 [Gemmata obscuriglobus]QEG28968.1 hypothetical protein GobsT_37570 [Gemmata obscuriglobus]VTS07511.1 DNA repair protein OS=delta proteobacterium NaphS2 GN=radC PE=3 SV=1: DUF935: ParBc [Gemmata obscuriglobus UQM 2246]